MVFVVFVVFVDRIIVKPALQAVLLVFGLCGSFVVLVWVVLWFLVTCGFWLWSARPIVLMWFLWVGGLALDSDADDCAFDRAHVVFMGRWSCTRCSMPTVARPLALFGLIKRFAHCPTSCYVPFRRHWGRPLQMEKTIMARTSVKVRLRNVRIAYPRLFTPDEKTGKRSCLIMIPNDSEAAQAWRRGVAEAWRVAQDELSKASFPDNPQPALTRAMLGIKVAGEISPSGSVYPEEYADHIVFTASSKYDISVCNNRGNAINATDEELLYSGQIAHVAIELFPFKRPEKTGISRILQNVFIVGGGERINLGSGSNNLSAAEEWADEISESSSSSFDDDAASFPF